MRTEELNQMIEEYGRHLYSFCCNLTRNRNDADDLYQETFLKAIELRHRLDGSGNPKSFLMGISVRIWKNHRKKYAVRNSIVKMEFLDEQTDQVVGTDHQPETELIRHEKYRMVQKAMKEIPEKIRIVLLMHYTAELSVEEISKALHIPGGTVKSRLHNGRKRMKDYLEAIDYENE